MSNFDSRIRVTTGDITKLKVEAIVTAANAQLQGGGGVDRAVHVAAGPKLVEASLKLAPCLPGQARITPGFDLDVPYVIHAVGPIYKDGTHGESTILGNAYLSSLELAGQDRLESIAFPCISTGAYGFPHDQACQIAIDTVNDWMQENEFPNTVVFCCFEISDTQLYEKRLKELEIAFDSV